MSQPSVKTLIDAARSAFQTGATPTSDLTLFKDSAGHGMSITSANGCSATVYKDSAGHVIIGFQPTHTSVQQKLDQQILSGQSPSKIAGLSDALAFTIKVEKAAAAEGISTSDISVTGHSLGGTLAEYAASKTGLAGASFAGSGLADETNTTHAANFLSYVESGDPFANFGTDTGDRAVAQFSASHFDHYGTLVKIGSAAGYSAIASLVRAEEGLPFQFLIGRGVQAEAAVNETISADMNKYHSLTVYIDDIKAIPNNETGSYNSTLPAALSATDSSMSDVVRKATVDIQHTFLASAGLSTSVSPAATVVSQARIADPVGSGSLHDTTAAVSHPLVTATHHL